MSTTKWVIDPSHSEVQFKVKHLMVTTVTGHLTGFTSTVETSKEDFSDAKISFTADMNSFTTGSEQRDQHLKTVDFFETEKYPALIFTSTKFTRNTEGTYDLKGNLTIKGVSKEISLVAEFGGLVKDPWGNKKAAFNLNGKISRKEYGLVWNVVTEGGGVLVSDEVKLLAEVQFVEEVPVTA